uniref:Putative ovule protein n=1 Tax=Solanum chacoense TaxID=4108 RepID=A0A0V0I4I5_SOLCH
MYQKYRKLTVYQNPQLKHVVYPQGTHHNSKRHLCRSRHTKSSNHMNFSIHPFSLVQISSFRLNKLIHADQNMTFIDQHTS